MDNDLRYLAFLDILGFKDLINENSLEYVSDLYEKLASGIAFSLGNELLQQRDKSIPKPKIRYPIEANTMNSLVVSDSIILWTENSSRSAFYDIVTVARDIMYWGMLIGIPLRGAITVGNIVVKKGMYLGSSKYNAFNTILGKALTKAYVLENQLNFSGCIIDNECIERFNESENESENYAAFNKLETYMAFNLITKAIAPMKEGPVEQAHLINWTATSVKEGRFTEKQIRNAFSSHNKRINDWRVEEKIRNTIAFLNDTESDYQKLLKLIEAYDRLEAKRK